MSEAPDNVVELASAFKAAEPRKRRSRAKPEAPKDSAVAATPPALPPRPSLPTRLPDDSPVKALGTLEGMYFYLDALGQLRRNKQSEHGRLHILDLFPWAYLCDTWPTWQMIDGVWIKKNEFNHGYLAPVMMDSCKDKGVWDPSDRVRGCGTWVEDSGELVMHCGAHIWRALPVDAKGAKPPCIRDEAGIKGDLLYPRRAPLAEPDFRSMDQTGPRILSQLETWNFKRGDLDQKIVLGWLVAALLGQAPAWRPMMWVTGGAGTGKSTLQRLIEWILGDHAAVKPAATSAAYVYQKIGDSALPVLLDEFEAKEENKRQQDVIELMRIAASGGELGRGGSENNPRTYTLKSCFAAFSIMIPPLTPQDRSRMAIVELRKLRVQDEGEELDFGADDHDMTLGNKDRWTKTGRELRGRVMTQWPRYRRTYHGYFRALQKAGLDARAASQFGALGAGQDLALFNEFEEANALAWADMLKGDGMSETKGYMSEPEGCLQHLLSATPDAMRHGARETVAHWMRTARGDQERDENRNDPDDANRILAKLGIRVDRDAKREQIGPKGLLAPVWWIAISSTHPALGEIFKTTHWKGRAGAPGTWAQALRGLEGTKDRARQIRIDGRPHWVTEIMWEGVFPPGGDDAEEGAPAITSKGDMP